MKFDRRIFRRASAKWQPPRGKKVAGAKQDAEIETSSGLKVRSKLEKACVEYLEKHQIDFKYEPLLLLDGRKFRPDFYFPEQDFFLEIAGYTHMPFYRDRLAEKSDLYSKYKLDVRVIRPKNMSHLNRELDSIFAGLK